MVNTRTNFKSHHAQQWGYPSGSVVKNPPAKQEARVQSLGREGPLEEEMAAHSSVLAERKPMDRGAWWATVHGITKESDMN